MVCPLDERLLRAPRPARRQVSTWFASKNDKAREERADSTASRRTFFSPASARAAVAANTFASTPARLRQLVILATKEFARFFDAISDCASRQNVSGLVFHFHLPTARCRGRDPPTANRCPAFCAYRRPSGPIDTGV